MAEAPREKGECSGPWQTSLPSRVLRPTAVCYHTNPIPMLEVEVDEEEEDVDVETMFSSEDNDLSCARQMAGSTSKGGANLLL